MIKITMSCYSLMAKLILNIPLRRKVWGNCIIKILAVEVRFNMASLHIKHLYFLEFAEQ